MLRLVLPFVLLVVGALSLAARQPDSLAAADARVASMEAHLEQVEAVRAVKRLQYAYGHYVELGLWHDFAELFTDGAVTNYTQGVRGKEEVRSLFLKQVGQGKLGLADGRIYPHILFQPVVHLSPDGRTAKGRWRILAMLGGIGGTATWYSGVYENEYVPDGEAWKIGVLRSEPRATAAYTAAGWRDAGITLPPHYDAANVARPVTSVAVSATGGVSPSPTVLAARLDGLVRRAAALEDQGAVANLQNRYGYAIDRKQWNQAADLFTADGTLEIGQRGVYVGRASIRRGLGVQGPQGLREGERNDHVYLQTLISVAPDGRTAQARGVEVIFSAAPGGTNGELSEGTFENTFVKQNGEWRIQSVHFYPRMIVEAASGWSSRAKPAPGPSREFPPDRPPTSAYAIYPAFAVAPFHFDNPVTGKPPQYPEGVPATVRPATASQAAAPPSNVAPAVRSPRDVDARLAALERSIAAAEAYDALENLINAFAYGRDGTTASDGSTSFANHVSQPVIEIDKDGRRARIRARLLELRGHSGDAGGWTAGMYQGTAIRQNGTWQLQAFEFTPTWSGSYPGGWARP